MAFDDGTLLIFHKKAWMKQPHLTAVCRQIREETLPIYYGLNKFELNVDARTSSRLARALKKGSPTDVLSAKAQGCTAFLKTSRWLRAIGDHNARLIKRFEIKMSAKEDYQRALFSSIVPYSKKVEQGLCRLLDVHSPTSPPTISVMVQEAVVEPPTFTEVLEGKGRSKIIGKELLQTKRSATDLESPMPT